MGSYNQNHKPSTDFISEEWSEDKPIEDFNKGDDAEAKAESKQSTDASQEVNSSHSFGLFIFWI